jgi:hypothetical protein
MNNGPVFLEMLINFLLCQKEFEIVKKIMDDEAKKASWIPG